MFLLGVCEGAFPVFPGGSAVFSDRDCQTLEEMELPVAKSKESQMADARLAAYKLLSSASHALYLTYPQVTVTQQKCYPSAVTAQMQRMFPGAETLRQSCSSLGTSYYSATLHAAYYQYVQNYAEQSADTASVGALLWDDPVYAQRLEGLTRFTVRHDENEPLFSIADTALVGHYLGDTMQLSASALERYQKCPFLYYCNDILRLYQRQKMQMTGANSGSMVHFCLEQILRQYDKEHFLALSPEELKQEIQLISVTLEQ